MRIGLAGKPKEGELVSGDAHFVRDLGGTTFVCLIDALGHGNEAHLVSQKLLGFLSAHDGAADLENLARRCHEELRGTRGVVAGMVLVHEMEERLSYVGVGNITAALVCGDGDAYLSKASHLVSVGGVLGYNLRKVLRFEHAFGPRDWLVMFTDGVSAQFDIGGYVSDSSDPQEVANHVLEEQIKGHDDALVLVVAR